MTLSLAHQDDDPRGRIQSFTLHTEDGMLGYRAYPRVPVDATQAREIAQLKKLCAGQVPFDEAKVRRLFQVAPAP